VLAGPVVVGRLVRLAVERHVRDLRDGAARGLRFDEAAGDHAIRFFGFLRHSKGEWGKGGGRIFELSPWQAFIVWCVFGWKNAGWHAAVPGRLQRDRPQERQEHVRRGHRTVPVRRRRRAGRRGLHRRDEARPGPHRPRRGVRMVKKSPPLKKRIGVFKDNLHAR
jgi:hypothetical protein